MREQRISFGARLAVGSRGKGKRSRQANLNVRLICGLLPAVCGGFLGEGCLKPDSHTESGADASSSVTAKTPAAKAALSEIDPQLLARRAFHEAPMLAERVASGELPPVADRLP